jgi:uncharacterized repeat protein (TIGR03803 family)
LRKLRHERLVSNLQKEGKVYSFDRSAGRGLEYLAPGTDDNSYGTTEYGGSTGDGTVYKITPAGEIAALHSFDKAGGRLLDCLGHQRNVLRDN